MALTLSAEAIARFTAASAGPKNSFASMLTKKTYKDGAEKDWGVWHYHGDFPLDGTGVRYEWLATDE